MKRLLRWNWINADGFLGRLGTISNECEECEQSLSALEDHFTEVKEQIHQLTKEDYKNHYKKTETISSHLQKKHELMN